MSTRLKGGFGGSLNWLIGGAVGGLVGSLLFGALLWVADPAIVTETIPAMYGLDTAGAAGWAFHLVHGVVLGIVFGFLVTRELILGTITADVETDFIAAMNPTVRISLAGLVYGLAIWAILPGIAQTIYVSAGEMGDSGFPVAAIESLTGHLLYGLLLGALFSAFVDLTPDAEEAEAPFEEASDSPTE